MKCALVIPAWVPEDIFPSRTASSQINYWQPLGTLYVAAVLQKAGHEVQFFNGAFLSHEQVLREVERILARLYRALLNGLRMGEGKKNGNRPANVFGNAAFLSAPAAPIRSPCRSACLEDAG